VIVSKCSNLCVNDPGGSGNSGTPVIQWTTGTDTNEVWHVIPTSDGNYTLVNKWNNLALNGIPGSSPTVDQESQQSGNTDQEWSLTSQGGGYYELQNVGTGLVLDDPNSSLTNGQQLDIASWVGGTNQLWSLQNIPPVTIYSASGPNGSNWWYTGAVTVTLIGTDSSLDPVTATYYTVDGGSQQTYSGPFTVSGDAVHTITYWSVDAAGNKEPTNSQTIKIDSTPPVTTASVSNSRVTLTATDNLSGVAVTYYQVDGGSWQTYSAPFTVSSGASHSVGFSSNDNAGNHEPNQYITVP
jgi:hypothetical protein